MNHICKSVHLYNVGAKSLKIHLGISVSSDVSVAS